MATFIAAVVEVVACDDHALLCIEPALAVVEVSSSGVDQRVAVLCSDTAAVVVDARQRTDIKGPGLNRAAFVVEVITVFEHARDARGERVLQAGQGTATVVDVIGRDTQLAVLGDDLAVEVVDVAAGFEFERGLTLQRAFGVFYARSLQVEVGVLAVDQAAVVVLHFAAGRQQQLTVGGNGAAFAVIQAAGEQGHHALAGQLAALIIHLIGALQQQVPNAGECAAGIGQGAQQVEGGCVVGGDAAVGVVQIGTGDGQAELGADGAADVAQRHCGYNQRLCAVDLALVAVIQHTVDGERLPCPAGQATLPVIDVVRADRQRFLANQRACVAVVQVAAEFDADFAVEAGELAVVAVVELAAFDFKALQPRDQAQLVKHLIGFDRERFLADQATVIAVVEGAASQPDTCLAGDFTPAVIQVCADNAQVALAINFALGIEEIICVDAGRISAEHLAAIAVIQRTCGNFRETLCADNTAAVIQDLIHRNTHVMAGNHTAVVTHVVGADLDIARGIAGVVVVDARFDDRVVGQLPLGTKFDLVTSRDILLNTQCIAGLQIHATAINRSLHIGTGSFDGYCSSGSELRNGQVAVGVDLNIAAAGSHFPVEFYPNPGFAAHQLDRPSVHPTQS